MKNAVLVIGASSDIGHAVIEKLVTSNTVIAHTNTTSLSFGRFSGRQKEEIHQVQADLSDEESVSSLIQTILEMSVIPTKVVHLAAIPPENTRLTELAWLDYERHLSVNVKSFQIIVSNLLPTMVKKRHGRIVTMSTSYIHGCPPPFLSHYVTAKYALEGMTKAIASNSAKKVSQQIPFQLEWSVHDFLEICMNPLSICQS